MGSVSRRLFVRAGAAALIAAAIVASTGGSRVTPQPAARPLQIHFLDSEGGGATLVVTPAGESVLMDAGWSDQAGRDARRIQAAMARAGVTRIDHLVISHYHMDHYGGVPDLAKLVPISRYYDHGPLAAMTEDPDFARRYDAYRTAAAGLATTLTPDASIPLKAVGAGPAPTLSILASKSAVSTARGTPNDACGPVQPRPDTTENGRSVALLLRHGAFEFVNLGDLTWNISQRLVCPTNRIGPIDLYQVTHHGGSASNDPILLRSLSPTVAVMINGARKGGHPDTIRALTGLPSLRALYQLHRNVQIDAAMNAPAEFIANPGESPDDAHAIVVAVDVERGSFTVTNGRTGEARAYPITRGTP